MIPKELGITLDKALTENPELRKEYEENEEVRYLIDMSKRLEGLPRNTSMHAAGVVISEKPAVEYVPLSRAQDGSITTQYTMTTLEELGLLKMDFLGLRTLTVIQNAVRLVKQSRGIDIEGRVARQLNAEDVAKADVILTMTEGVSMAVLALFSQAEGKVFTLGEYVDEPGDVDDPYGCDEEVYHATADQIDGLLEKLLKKIG
jgi:DNA polymerase III alpha subunit